MSDVAVVADLLNNSAEIRQKAANNDNVAGPLQTTERQRYALDVPEELVAQTGRRGNELRRDRL